MSAHSTHKKIQPNIKIISVHKPKKQKSCLNKLKILRNIIKKCASIKNTTRFNIHRKGIPCIRQRDSRALLIHTILTFTILATIFKFNQKQCVF